jgi:hypothetical protein
MDKKIKIFQKWEPRQGRVIGENTAGNAHCYAAPLAFSGWLASMFGRNCHWLLNRYKNHYVVFIYENGMRLQVCTSWECKLISYGSFDPL